MAQVAGSFLAAGDSAAMPPAAYIPWANDEMPQERRVFDPGNPRKIMHMGSEGATDVAITPTQMRRYVHTFHDI